MNFYLMQSVCHKKVPYVLKDTVKENNAWTNSLSKVNGRYAILVSDGEFLTFDYISDSKETI